MWDLNMVDPSGALKYTQTQLEEGVRDVNNIWASKIITINVNLFSEKIVDMLLKPLISNPVVIFGIIRRC